MRFLWHGVNAFLPNWLLQGMFYIILQSLCGPFLISCVKKMILWRELYQWRLLLCSDFDWFHSNLNKQKPTKRAFSIVLRVKVNCMQEVSVCSQILPWHYAVPRSAIFTTLHNSIRPRIWHMEAWNPLKWIVRNNNDMNVCNNEYFCPQWSYYWRKPLFTLPLVQRKEHNYCTI